MLKTKVICLSGEKTVTFFCANIKEKQFNKITIPTIFFVTIASKFYNQFVLERNTTRQKPSFCVNRKCRNHFVVYRAYVILILRYYSYQVETGSITCVNGGSLIRVGYEII